jgi:hypothetical protein
MPTPILNSLITRVKNILVQASDLAKTAAAWLLKVKEEYIYGLTIIVITTLRQKLLEFQETKPSTSPTL